MYDVQTARERDGNPAEDRSERVDELLRSDRVGYGEGDPLAADDYGQYPDDATELSAPKWLSWTEALLSHDRVNSYDDAVVEATPATDQVSQKKWREAIQNAANAAQLDAGDLFDHDDDGEQEPTEDPLTALTEAWPDDAVRSDNPLVVARLYGGLGLSTVEVADLFGCSESHVCDILRQCGLLEATDDEQVDPKREKDIRLGGASFSQLDDEQRSSSGGLNVAVEDFGG